MKRDNRNRLGSNRPGRGKHEWQPVSLLHSLHRSTAFTLIEMIGALAVVAILASLMVPAVVRQVDKAARTKEITDMAAISNAIVMEAVRDKRIPGPSNTDWPQAAAKWLDRPAAQVLANPRGVPRAFVIDPAFQLGGSGLPYTQTTNGAPRPNSARIMILSSIGSALPVSSGVLSAASFNDIWNTPSMVKPASWAAWSGGKGEDLVIQRINMEPLFYRLILVNRGANNAATFSIDGNNPQQVPGGNLEWDAYYLDGTMLNLNSTNILVNQTLLKRDVSYVFENGAWLDQIVNPPPNNDLTKAFALNLSVFLGAGVSTNQQIQASAMLNFMLDHNMSVASYPSASIGAQQMMDMQIGIIATNLPPSLPGLLNDVLGGLLGGLGGLLGGL